MHKLTYMFIAIICLISMLVLNAMGILAYENSVLSAETQKSNMLSLSDKYDYLLDNLKLNARLYINTNDEKFRTNYYVLRDEYLYNDNITVQYNTFIMNPFYKNINKVLTDTNLDLTNQARYLNFNKTETDTYNEFKLYYNRAIFDLTRSVEEKNMDLITNISFDEINNNHGDEMISLSKSYIIRINADEESILKNKKFLEISLVLLSLCLVIMSAFTYYAIIKENRYNSYSRKLYNTIVENFNAGLCLMDKDYIFEYMNPMYKQIMGVNYDNIEGKSLTEIFNQSISEIIENTIKRKNNEIGEMALIIDNVKKNISYYFFHIKDEYGNFKYIHLINDITDTAQLQSQLEKQLKEIKYYSHAKDIFIANISHEIKTPINAILGMVHFLKNTNLSESQKDLVNKIENSSDILFTIINDVLDITKMRNNSLSLYPSDFALIDVVRNIEDMFISQIVNKGLLWECKYDFNKNLCIHLDRTRLVQVIVNLLTNAIKFTNTGSIKFSVEVIYDGYEIVQLQFCIEDTGIGIAEKDISKLFHEFEQLDNDLTKQHKGTGLGLYICKNILDSMGGRIWVKTAKGEGSKFYFSIPAAKAYNPALLIPDNEKTPDAPFDGNDGHALVVEDTEINAELTVKFLNDVNVNCDVAVDGLEAIDICKKHPADYYNIILMDIHMPKMDGFTAANILKKEMGIKSPIVAITASSIDEPIKGNYTGIIDDYILKPFKISAFYKTISACYTHCSKNPIFVDPQDEVLRDNKENADSDHGPFSGKQEAIKNLGGLESIYYKHLLKFKVNYSNTPAEIKAFLDEGSIAEARRLAHSIKGLGGTLGMLDVQKAAAALEQAILNGDTNDINMCLDNFEKELMAAIDLI